MFRTILVPLDGSEFGECALPLAQALSERTQAALHLILVHVPVYGSYVEGTPILDIELDTASRANDQAYLQAVQQRLAASGGCPPGITHHDGQVADTLVAHASQINADLIVMTTHGRGGLARLWLGSVADTVVRHSHVPVLLVRPDVSPEPSRATPTQAIRRVLVALDGSARAEQMLAPTLALGSVFDVDYTFVRVVDPLFTSSPLVIGAVQREIATIQEQQRHAQHYLENLAMPLRSEGYRVNTRVLVDPQPAHAILREAHTQGSDVIAVATHGHGGVRRFLLGSVADKVLRGTDKSVLLYRCHAARKRRPTTTE